MSNDFRESMKVDISSQDSEVSNVAEKNALNYTILFNIPEVREYFVYVASALTLVHYSQYRKSNEMPGLKVKFRFKSFNSLYNKSIENYIKYGSVDFPISDAFAMTMITDVLPVVPTITDTPVRYTSEDSRLKKLIDKKIEDDEFSKSMRSFKDRFVEDDSFEPIVYQSNTDVTQEEYYSNCLKVLNRTKSLINPVETEIIAPIEESILLIENKLDVVRSLGTEKLIIPNSELMDESTSFANFFRNYERRKDRELAITLLTREIKLLFQNPRNSDIFSKLGIKLSEDKKQKIKAKPNGYESIFNYLDFLFLTVENQTQTNGQYLQGKTGTAAHGQYKITQAKKIGDFPLKETHYPIPIPSPEQMAIPEISENFLQEVKNMSPRKYKLEIERGRAVVIENGLLDNYRLNFQETTDSMTELFNQYLSILESRTDSPLNKYPTKNIQYYTLASVENYLASPNFEKVKKIHELWTSHPKDFAEKYFSSQLSFDKTVEGTINLPGQMQIDFFQSHDDNDGGRE